MNEEAEGGFGHPLNIQLVLEGREVPGTGPSHLTLWRTLGILSGHFRRLSHLPKVSKLMKDEVDNHFQQLLLL